MPLDSNQYGLLYTSSNDVFIHSVVFTIPDSPNDTQLKLTSSSILPVNHEPITALHQGRGFDLMAIGFASGIVIIGTIVNRGEQYNSYSYGGCFFPSSQGGLSLQNVFVWYGVLILSLVSCYRCFSYYWIVC